MACHPCSDFSSGSRPTKSRRRIWLEDEICRINRDVIELAEENEELRQKLGGTEDPLLSFGPKRNESTPTHGISLLEVKLEDTSRSGEPVRDFLTDELFDIPKGASWADNAGSFFPGVNAEANLRNGQFLGKILIYLAAIAGVILVLVGTASAAKDYSSDSDGTGVSEHYSRGATASPLMRSIAITLTCCGFIAFFVHVLEQPLILGYILGGVLAGPIGLEIVHSHHDISELSSLGLIFLLFMIGLELDVKALLQMGKVVLLTGLVQFPICAGIQIALFSGLQAIGLNFGTGPYAALYAGMVCGISSTMIVVKMLGEKGETPTEPGRLTIGILIFQDIWAIVVLAIQPNLASPEIVGILKTFGMIILLIILAMAYAKFVMPAVLYYTSRNLELMLVLSLSWCFYIGVIAILPFVGLSMELAALIAGVALAAFPYSAEFNGKIKYIRDFFITLFFAGLGMQIPVPSVGAIAMGLLIAVFVLLFRWLGIFMMVVILGGGPELGAIATINLSQVSEFALVICSLGMGFGHINDDTMVMIIWAFAILAISSSYLIGYNHQIYAKAAALGNRLRGKHVVEDADKDDDGHDHEARDIVLLGYHKIAFMLIAEVKAKSPQLLKKIHIIDYDQGVMPKLREIGVHCSYGDISSADVLEHAFHGDPKLVISTMPDSALKGVNNEGLVRVTKSVWPDAHIIVTADNPEQAKILYNAGANYVLRMAKLCAERLHELLSENQQHVFGGGELDDLFAHFKRKDKV